MTFYEILELHQLLLASQTKFKFTIINMVEINCFKDRMLKYRQIQRQENQDSAKLTLKVLKYDGDEIIRPFWDNNKLIHFLSKIKILRSFLFQISG